MKGAGVRDDAQVAFAASVVQMRASFIRRGAAVPYSLATSRGTVSSLSDKINLWISSRDFSKLASVPLSPSTLVRLPSAPVRHLLRIGHQGNPAWLPVLRATREPSVV